MTAQPAENPGAATRSRVRRECRAAVRALGRRDDPHAGIHEARKAIRRLRSVLRLVRGRFDGIRTVDAELAGLCESLSALRDCHVLVAAAQSLAGNGDPAPWTPLVRHLAGSRDLALAAALANDPGFEGRRSVVRRLAGALDALDWDRLQRKDLAAGWERSQARAARAGKSARKDPTRENLHRYRRRLRRLRMQWEALQAIAPDLVESTDAPMTRRQVKALRGLSDRLGRAQDLQALRSALLLATGVPGRSALLSRVSDELERTAGEPAADESWVSAAIAGLHARATGASGHA